ncbi:MAG: hypothetical protein AAGC73_06660 [Verrucomicrobiota bacterium]
MQNFTQFLVTLLLFALSFGTGHGVVLSLSSGGVELNYDDNDTDSASLLVDGVDNLYEYGFYFRRPNGSIAKLTNGSLLDPDTLRYEQNNVVIDISFALPSTNAPDVDVSIDITSNRRNDFSGSIFFYFDYDLNNGITGHDASITGDTMTVTEPGGVTAQITGTDADAYQIAEYSGLRTSIETGNSLDNTGDGFTNGDFTGAFQWDFTLSQGESVTYDSVAVLPEASNAGLILGICAILWSSRRNLRLRA